jgi:glycosyltransferase involved in cell wall biosynthesis
MEISVLIPVHNGMPHLTKAIGSILGQTFRDFELLVIDDGSTDDTPSYVRSLGDPRIGYHRLDKTGLVGALNYGLRLARGAFVARIDADDIAYPERLEKQYGLMTRDEGCVLSSSHFDCIDEDGNVTGERFNPVTDPAIRWIMLFTPPFVHPGAMYSRCHALAMGGYRSEFPIAQDYDLWTRLAARGKLANYPEKLLQKRSHPASVSANNRGRQLALTSRIAGAYGESVSAKLKAGVMSELFLFLAAGKEPEGCTIDDLVRIYREAKAVFLGGTAALEAEMKGAVAGVQRKLRWRCLQHAEMAATEPRKLLRWLRLARMFDPEGGTVREIIRRKMTRLLGFTDNTVFYDF